MPQNNTDVVGRKSGKLLQGLLMGLYGISGVEANPEYLAPGVEGPVGQGGNLPFKGVGAFGGLKAKGANAEFIGQNALADAATARTIAMLPRKLAIENEAAMNLWNAQRAAENEQALKIKGEQGNILQGTLGDLSSDEFNLVGPDPKSSIYGQTGAPLYDWYNAKYGANTPLIKAPGIAAEQANVYNLERNPLTLANRQQAEINKGNIQLGGAVFNPSAPEGQQYIRGDSWQPYQETVEIPTGEMTLGADGQLVPKMGIKVISRQQFNPGGMGDITDLRITDDDLNAARDITLPQTTPRQFGVDEAPKTPPTTTTLTTKPPASQLTGIIPSAVNNLGQLVKPAMPNFGSNPDLANAFNSLKTEASNLGPNLSDLRKSLIGNSTETLTNAKPPIMPLFPDAYISGIRGGIQAVADPVRELLQNLGYVINPGQLEEPSPEPLPYPRDWLLKRLQNRAINIPNPNLQSR